MADIWTSIKNADLTWNHELELHSQWDVIEAIAKATIERCQASEVAVPSIVPQNGTVAGGTTITLTDHNLQVGELVYLQWTRSSVTYREYNIEITARDTDSITVATAATDGAITVIIQTVKRIYSIKTYADAIQTKVTELIPKFVNHFDNYGNWNGQILIPVWSEATMLTAINAGSRLVADRINILGAWTKQQFLIINNLLWVFNSRPWAEAGNHTTQYKYYGSAIDFPDAVAGFNALTTWTNTSASNFPKHYSIPDGGFYIYRFRSKIVHTNNTAFTVKIDTYMMFEEARNYENNDYPIAKNLLYKASSEEVTNGNSIASYIGDWNNATVTGVDLGWQTKTGTNRYLILKFDGINGFKFRDYILTNNGAIVTDGGVQVTI